MKTIDIKDKVENLSANNHEIDSYILNTVQVFGEKLSKAGSFFNSDQMQVLIEGLFNELNKLQNK